MSLYDQIVKIAYLNPGVVQDTLVPCLVRHKSARWDSWKETISGEKVRIRFSHDAIMLEEIPTKPLKSRKMRKLILDLSYAIQTLRMSPFLPININIDAKFNSSMDYDKALKALKKGLLEAKKIVEEGSRSVDERTWRSIGFDFNNLERSQTTVPYLTVEPVNYTPATVEGKDFTLKSEWNSFSAYMYYGEHGPQSHDPSYSRIHEKSPAAARKLFNKLRTDPDQLKNVYWSDLGDWLDKNKIKYSMSSSTWR